MKALAKKPMSMGAKKYKSKRSGLKEPMGAEKHGKKPGHSSAHSGHSAHSSGKHTSGHGHHSALADHMHKTHKAKKK